MNKKLLTQIKNEWRSNLWLVTELLLVSVVMWYIVDYMYVKAAVYYEPRTVLSFKTIPIILVILRKTIIFAHSDA